MIILLTVSLLACIDGVWWVMYSYLEYLHKKRVLEEKHFHSLHHDADDYYARLLSFVVKNKNELCTKDILPTLSYLEKKVCDMNLLISPDSAWVHDRFLECISFLSREKFPHDKGFMWCLHRSLFENLSVEAYKNSTFQKVLVDYLECERHFLKHVRNMPGSVARKFRNLSAHRALEVTYFIKDPKIKNNYFFLITDLPSMYLPQRGRFFICPVVDLREASSPQAGSALCASHRFTTGFDKTTF